MGLVTIFVRDDCAYCSRVSRVLAACVRKILSEDPAHAITIQEVKANGAYAALCTRLTRSFTVPHVFFNMQYIGDSNMTCLLAEKQDGCNLIMNQLRSLAQTPNPDPPFPPPPEAVFVKVTDEVACSSQPTTEQLGGVGSFGIKSVVCLVSPAEAAFVRPEASLVTAQHLQYVNAPCADLDERGLLRALAALRSATKPCLVHDDTGERAAIVTLLHVALDLGGGGQASATEQDFVEWGKQLNLDLCAFAPLAVGAFHLDRAQQKQASS
jgi:glutaredoxin/protein tyrosine phosphatase (PTP) superfamily phosphohydrolase (DUF442 family)